MVHSGEDYLHLELVNLVFPPSFLAVRLFAAGEVDGLGRNLLGLELPRDLKGVHPVTDRLLAVFKH